MKRRSFFRVIAAALGIGGAAATQRLVIAKPVSIAGPSILPPPPHLGTRLFINGVEWRGVTDVKITWREPEAVNWQERSL